MQSPTFSALVAPMEKVRRVIWLAFNAATALYVVIAYAMFGSGRPMAAVVPDNPLAIPLIVVALLTALVSRRVAAAAMPERRLREIVARNPDPQALARNPQTRQVDQVRLQKIASLPPHEQRLLAAVSALFVPFVVQMAFNESIALYGLVLSFLTRTFPPVLPFAALALVLNLSVSPKLEPSLERVKHLPFQPSSTGTA
jgi:hypothetical protein